MPLAHRIALSFALTLAACDQNIPLAVPEDGGASHDADNWEVLDVPSTLRDEVDVLFVIDDSGSMSAKQSSLTKRFPALVASFEKTAQLGMATSYHIGVVTSDLGAAGISCGKNRGAKLQALGAAAPSGCMPPTGSANYIAYDQKTGENNLPLGQDLATTFACMATVGDQGCGFESQLEAAYRAVHDPIAENVGFLRPEALLAIVFITDEDDCSTDPNSDLFSANPAYGPLLSLRCTRFGLTCDSFFPLPDVAHVPFGACMPATASQGSKLIDLTKYRNLFTNPSAQGGIKADPRDVFLAAIAAPSTPVALELSQQAADCGADSSCTKLSSSCASPTDSGVVGDPAVRLNALVSAASNHVLGSICDDDYTATIDAVGQHIGAWITPPCFTRPLANPGAPSCVVEDITSSGGSELRTPIPQCGEGAPATPCWQVQEVDSCTKVCDPGSGGYQQLRIFINRGSQPGPVGAVPHVSCQVGPASANPTQDCGT